MRCPLSASTLHHESPAQRVPVVICPSPAPTSHQKDPGLHACAAAGTVHVWGTTQAHAHVHTHAPQPHQRPLHDSRRLISDCGTSQGACLQTCPRGAGMGSSIPYTCTQGPQATQGHQGSLQSLSWATRVLHPHLKAYPFPLLPPSFTLSAFLSGIHMSTS